MSNKLSLLVNFIGVDKMSGALRNIVGLGKQGSTSLRALNGEARSLKQEVSNTANLRKYNKEWQEARSKTAEARAELARMKREIIAGEPPTAKYVRSIQAAEKRLDRLSNAEKAAAARTTDLSRTLKKSGVDITRLSAHERSLGEQIARVNSRIEQQQRAIARTKQWDAFGQKLGNIGTSLTYGATLPMAAFGASAIRASRESSAAMAQVRASLASMGPVAGRSLAQLTTQATALMQTSLFDDDAILRGVTANLLTFGKVTGTVFDQAQQAAVDLSTKLGIDLQPATIMVGKALNDPIKGITALRRVGVSFTADQIKMVKAMEKTGDIAGQQGIIIAELKRQYGGSAQAARDADPGGALALSFGEFQQAVGDRLLPKLTPLVIKITDLIDSFGKLSPEMQNAAITGAVLVAGLGPALTLASNLKKLWMGVGTAFTFVKVAMTGAAAAEGGVATAALSLRAAGATALLAGKRFLVAGWRWAGMAAKFVIGKAAAATTALLGLGRAAMVMGWGFFKSGLLMLANPIVLIIAGIALGVGLAAYAIYTHWDTIKAAFDVGVKWVQGVLDGAVTWFSNIGSMMMQGLLLALNPVLLVNKLLSIAQAGVTAFKNFFGIKSPSRLMMEMGGHVTGGLAMGIDRGGGRAQGSMDRVMGGLAQSAGRPIGGGGIAAKLNGGPVLGGAAGGGGGQARPGGQPAGAMTLNITINGAQGQDVKSLAREVRREIEKATGVAARSSYEGDR